MTQNRETEEPVTVTDKRRIDPTTGEVRAPSGGQERSDSGYASGGQERSDSGYASGGQERSDSGYASGGQERSDSGDASGPAPSGPAPEVFAGETPEEADKAAELLADLQRVQADFANYRKRALRDQQTATERAKASVLGQLLPVLDDLDRARSHGDLEAGPLKSVADKLTTALAGLGLSAFGAEGEEFDPSLHEAVQHEGEGTRPVIGTVMRQGYKLGDLILRHALVGVVDTVDDEPAANADQADTTADGEQSAG